MLDLTQLKEAQRQLATKIRLESDWLYQSPTLIAGADVGFEAQGEITRAVIVVLNYPSLEMVEHQLVKMPTSFPYVPGFLSYREYPALLAAWNQLKYKPDLMLVDGHGVAHPRGIGIASHFGLLVDCPTIGVAKQRLFGEFQCIDKVVGNVVPLLAKANQIGWVLCTKKNCNPLFISPGHRVSMPDALFWVKQCLKGYKLPEPTRIADSLASRRPSSKKIVNINVE